MPSLVEVFNRDVVLSYLRPNPVAVSPLVQSGAFVSDESLRPCLQVVHQHSSFHTLTVWMVMLNRTMATPF